jgi:hypothetical protein
MVEVKSISKHTQKIHSLSFYQVNFVAYNQFHNGFVVCVGPEFQKPVLNLLKRCPFTNVVDNNSSVSVSIVCGCDSTKPFLTSCILVGKKLILNFILATSH